MNGTNDDQLAEVVAKVEPGARLVRAWTLAGGLSATTTAAEVERPDGSRRRLVVRQARDQSDRASRSLANEFRLLGHLRALGLATPRPCYLDESREILDRPCLVIDYMEGSPRFFAPDQTETAKVLAAQLAAIHEIDGSRPEFAFLPEQTQATSARLAEKPETIDDALGEGLIREVLRAHWPPAEPERRSLLHGDFWPGNVLWDNDRVVAVIDWEDASVGDPLADVGITRLDLLWAFGQHAMLAFTDHYLALNPSDASSLPLWDLVAAWRPAGALSSWAADWVDFGRPDVTPAAMRAAQRWFLERALATLRHS